MAYTFTTSADTNYVNFFDTDGTQLKSLDKNTTAVEWDFSANIFPPATVPDRVRIVVDGLRFNDVPISSIVINGASPSSQADFESKMLAIFPMIGNPIGATGTFKSADAVPKNITVTNGIITAIV